MDVQHNLNLSHPFVLPLDQNRFFIITTTTHPDNAQKPTQNIFLLRPLEGNPHAEKVTLTTGGIDFEYNDILNTAVKKFNQDHSDLRIELKDYSSIINNGGSYHKVLKAFDQFSSDLPSSMSALDFYSQSNLFSAVNVNALEIFIDSQTNKATFDIPEFYEILEFCQKYGIPETVGEPSISDNPEYDDLSTLIKTKQMALMPEAIINSPTDYVTITNLFEEPISLIGFPSPNPHSPLIAPHSVFAISALSSYPQECWLFLKYFLKNEHQHQLARQNVIPVLKSAYEEQISLAKRSEIPEYKMSDTSEQAYRLLLENIRMVPPYDEEINLIIEEEVAAYFAGNKPAKQVAHSIENRVQRVLDERGS